MKTYSWRTFLADLPAGVLVAILLVPQAIAYAYLAGMPPQYGLYAALVPIFIYAFLGTSPHLAIGPVAICSILILAGVSQLAEPFTPKYIELTILAGLLIGILQMLMGLLRLGKYVNLLSYPVLTGFTSAASVIIISNQLKEVFGIDLERFEYFHKMLIESFKSIPQTHWLTLSIAIFSVLLIFSFRRINRKIPEGLIIVVFGIAFSYYYSLSSKGVEIIGFVPQGLPSFSLPSLSISDVISVLPIVILVALIGVIESLGIAKAIENKNHYYEVDTNMEMIAIGLSKIGGSFFGALPSSGSFSRSALLHESRGKTTMASIFTVIFVALSLLFLTSLLHYLPKVILAIIIIYAVKNMFEFTLAKKLFRDYKFDFAVMLVTFLSTLFISIEIGVAIGFLFSLFNLQSAKQSLLKGITKIFTQNYKHDIYFDKMKNGKTEVRLVVLNNLHFGNESFFKDLINKHIESHPSITKINIQFSEKTKVDISALKTLQDVRQMLCSKAINYRFLNVNSNIEQLFINEKIVLTTN